MSEQTFSLIYNVPLFALAGIWLIYRIRQEKTYSAFRILMDVSVIALAASRLFSPISPASGHALFLAHTLITIRSRVYRTVAALMLIATIAIKLSRDDYSSWLIGILAGSISGAVWTYNGWKPDRPLPSKQESI